MKVLITGVSGFIGSKLLDAICSRYGSDNVIVLSSKLNEKCKTVIYSDNYTISEKDINKIKDVDLIIHAGAFIPKSRNESNHINNCNSNMYFTGELLSVPFSKLRKVIYLSTVDVYGNTDLIDEDSNVEPVSLYGYSKLYCEKMVQFFCEENNIISQTLRVGHVYGPGEEKYEKLLPIAINKILKSQPVDLWGDGDELRAFIYVDDVVSACLSATELEKSIGVVNVCGGKSISVRELLTLLSEISNKELKLNTIPSSGSPRNLIFNNKKMLDNLLCYETDFNDGLEKEIEHIRGLS